MVWPGTQDVSAAFAARDIAFRALVFVGGERSQHFGLLAPLPGPPPASPHALILVEAQSQN